jgi:putative flippase GtrA
MALVALVRALYGRFQQLIHEAAKFGVIGAIAFVVTTVGTNLLHFQVGLGPLTSNVIATIVATFVSYAGNRYWTFRHREGSTMTREYVVFFVLNGIGLAIQLACIGVAYYLLGLTDKLSYNIALIVGIGLGTLFRFWSYRKWVWVAPPETKAETGAGERQPQPTDPPMAPHLAARPARQHVPSRNGDGHAHDGLHANGHGTNGRGGTNGHGGSGQGAHTGSASRNGWDG